MTLSRKLSTVCLVAAALLGASVLPSAAEGLSRTELNRADVSGADGLEVVVSRLEIAPGATVPPHSHPGDEHLIVLDGGTLAMPDGKTLEFKPGMALMFPKGKVHGNLTNAGTAPIVVYTTHIIQKGQPLTIPAK